MLLDDDAIERIVKSSLVDVDVDTYAHAQDELYSDSSDDSVDDSQADYDDQLSLIQLQLKVLNPTPYTLNQLFLVKLQLKVPKYMHVHVHVHVHVQVRMQIAVHICRRCARCHKNHQQVSKQT